MTPEFENLQKALKRLPGLGHRSAERIALRLLVEAPEELNALIDALRDASESVRPCPRCGGLAETELCVVCSDEDRDARKLCVVEGVTDVFSIERSGSFRGKYHVLGGKLSPIRGVGPEKLNLSGFRARIEEEGVEELILALANDVEGEATCHFIREEALAGIDVKVTRIGFGIPGGAGVTYADERTLRSAMDARRAFD